MADRLGPLVSALGIVLAVAAGLVGSGLAGCEPGLPAFWPIRLSVPGQQLLDIGRVTPYQQQRHQDQHQAAGPASQMRSWYIGANAADTMAASEE